MSRDEIDARQHRCDQAALRPPLLQRAVEATMPELRRRLLTFAEAQAAGVAMFERAHLMAPELRLGMIREDSGWADMFNAGWEAVWALRQAEVQGEHAGGEDHRS